MALPLVLLLVLVLQLLLLAPLPASAVGPAPAVCEFVLCPQGEPLRRRLQGCLQRRCRRCLVQATAASAARLLRRGRELQGSCARNI